MIYVKPRKSYKLSNRVTIRNLENILKILDDEKPVLIGKAAIAAYENYYGLRNDRRFIYIKFGISKNKEKRTKEILYDPENIKK